MATSRRGHHRAATTFTSLTLTEVRVLEQLAQGRDTAEAAGQLKISVGTFNGHVGSIGRKLHVGSRAAKVHAAIVTGELSRPARVEPPEDFGPDDVELWRAVATRSRPQEIADAAGLSRATTREAIRDLMERAGAKNETHLVVLGHAFGVIATGEGVETPAVVVGASSGEK